MAIQKKTKKPARVSFNKAHLAKLIATLKFELSIREKCDKTRTPCFRIEVSSKVNKITEDEKWLLERLINAQINGRFDVVIGPCQKVKI